MEAIATGTYTVIRVDGTEEHYTSASDGQPSIQRIEKLIGADCLDSVNLRKGKTVMMVDDTGMVDGKPVNAKATALYHSICKHGTVFSIHGDVCLVRFYRTPQGTIRRLNPMPSDNTQPVLHQSTCGKKAHLEHTRAA